MKLLGKPKNGHKLGLKKHKSGYHYKYMRKINKFRINRFFLQKISKKI